jgi:hypothetical protein
VVRVVAVIVLSVSVVDDLVVVNVLVVVHVPCAAVKRRSGGLSFSAVKRW